ncbi:wax ester/triacylglycerol synthase domain-containing protein [Geodermatophilus aquaeductus]|nr:wax ester/triacylglycerol synthase domain-containing protein [Geodermatophilus aquaeductus]
MQALGRGGPSPMQLGAVLVLGPPAGGDGDGEELTRVVAERLGGVRRLRQRLVRVPPGAGRPVWADDPHPDPPAHVGTAACPHPGDTQSLLDLATELVAHPLPADRPDWSAVVVPDLPGGRSAVVVVLSHVLADGIGGLALLASLADGGPPPDRTPPRPLPPYRSLVADAWRSRVRSLAGWRSAAALVRDAARSAGGLRPPRAAPCSLLAPTGPRRRTAAVQVPLEPLRAAAHRAGGTMNDALLVAVAGALGALLESRGESVDPVAVTVVVAGRRAAGVTELGNATTPLVVAVPAAGKPGERLHRFAGTVRRARDQAAGPPLTALMGPVFRGLTAVGAYRWWLRHQRRFHTLVSNVRGPGTVLTLAGRPVEQVLPVASGEAGNVTVSFDALSYAGILTVTAVADPERVPDLPVLTAAVREQLAALVTPALGG